MFRNDQSAFKLVRKYGLQPLKDIKLSAKGSWIFSGVNVDSETLAQNCLKLESLCDMVKEILPGSVDTPNDAVFELKTVETIVGDNTLSYLLKLAEELEATKAAIIVIDESGDEE